MSDELEALRVAVTSLQEKFDEKQKSIVLVTTALFWGSGPKYNKTNCGFNLSRGQFNMESFVLARALHVIAVVMWIGGVAFVTTVLIPSIKRIPDKGDRLALFEKLEGKFSFQAKATTLITGASGYYMLHVMDAWSRYQYLEYWWMHLMTLVWTIFTLVLFVLEPLVLHRWFMAEAIKDSDNAFLWLHRMHTVLLSLSIIAIFGAVAGSHGFSF